MKDLRELDGYRQAGSDVMERYGWAGDETCGVFELPSPMSGSLRCIASANDGWDHVSVSLPNRIPNWLEMQHVHRAFFRPDEVAWEYHMPPADHISIHPNCLHLWRKHGFSMPTPPKEFV